MGLCAATELPVTRPRLARRSPAATFNWNPFWSVLNAAAAVPTRMDVNESWRTRLAVQSLTTVSFALPTAVLRDATKRDDNTAELILNIVIVTAMLLLLL